MSACRPRAGSGRANAVALTGSICACECVIEREGERERGKEKKRRGKRDCESNSACVHECVCADCSNAPRRMEGNIPYREWEG